MRDCYHVTATCYANESSLSHHPYLESEKERAIQHMPGVKRNRKWKDRCVCSRKLDVDLEG